LTILGSSEYYIPASVYDLSAALLRDTQLVWTSTDPSHLAIDQRGLARLLTPGNVGVYANYGSIQSNTFWFNIVDGALLIPFSVSGRVTSVAGAGVAGVTIYISGGDIKSFIQGGEMTVISHVAISDSEGNYRVDGLGNGLYTVNLFAQSSTFSPSHSVVQIFNANNVANFIQTK
jgi:hypothetical protein